MLSEIWIENWKSLSRFLPFFISLLYSLYWIVFTRSVVIKLAWHMTWMLCKEYIMNKNLPILSQVKIGLWVESLMSVSDDPEKKQSGNYRTGPGSSLLMLCPPPIPPHPNPSLGDTPSKKREKIGHFFLQNCNSLSPNVGCLWFLNVLLFIMKG